jgi:hypothetical protein
MEDRPYRGEGSLHQRFRLFARAFGDPEFAADPHRACCDHGDKPGLNLSVLWPARLPGAGGLLWQINKSLPPYVSHSAAEGALPSLFAATSPEAKAAGYYGPNGFYELKGPPGSGEDHAAGERRSSCGTALGCLRRSDSSRRLPNIRR